MQSWQSAPGLAWPLRCGIAGSPSGCPRAPCRCELAQGPDLGGLRHGVHDAGPALQLQPVQDVSLQSLQEVAMHPAQFLRTPHTYRCPVSQGHHGESQASGPSQWAARGRRQAAPNARLGSPSMVRSWRQGPDHSESCLLSTHKSRERESH
jgi:hypothetical protein